MKRISAIIIIIALMGSVVLAQENLKGTEDPVSYGSQKQRILERQENLRRSQAIQNVAQTYREMVSAYKAKRIVYAEEMSQKLTRLLEDPMLPRVFAGKMARKQNAFLEKVYGDHRYLTMDVPVDKFADGEIEAIQEVLDEKMPVEQDRVKKSFDTELVKTGSRSEAVKINGAEMIPQISEQKNNEPIIDREVQKDKRLYEYQQKLFDMDRGDIDHYVALYEQDQRQRKESLSQEFDEKIDLLYQEGASLFQKRSYRFAREILTEVESLRPDYKLTRQFLAQLEKYFKYETERSVVFSDNGDVRQKMISDALDSYQQ